jgi:hypothetical protein
VRPLYRYTFLDISDTTESAERNSFILQFYFYLVSVYFIFLFTIDLVSPTILSYTRLCSLEFQFLAYANIIGIKKN